jgi:stearoyl-CoA desaturase (Delta-9 desaturase)
MIPSRFVGTVIRTGARTGEHRPAAGSRLGVRQSPPLRTARTAVPLPIESTLKEPHARLDWVNISFIAAAHLLALAGIAWLIWAPFSWWTFSLTLVYFAFCGVSITGGYHRLFSHPTYKTGVLLRLFYLLFGAASVQNSALKWSADHRKHHREVDDKDDPYNIRRGFWWAHIGWVLHRDTNDDFSIVPDLTADPLLRFQHRFYLPLAIVMGALLPLALGWAWGDPIGALLLAGFLRLVLQYHATFAVNSVAHYIGSQPYTDLNSARDSFLTALITLGEGYHNFHHRFQADYRNGVRWFHFDPTKWWVWSLSKLGVTHGLRRIPLDRIRAAREQMSQKVAA